MEPMLIGFALLLLAGVIASKISDRFGIPALLLFLGLGILAGGPGRMSLDDPAPAQFIGGIALALILFSGGLETNRDSIRPVLKYGFALSTLGVLITALVVGAFAVFLFDFSLPEGLLIGSIVSSTDAAAVFSILRSKGVGVRERLKALLELESGSNDPMAVFLTIASVQILTRPSLSWADLVLLFGLQMSLGIASGYALGWGMIHLVNRLRLGYEGLYSVLTLSLVLSVYGLANWVGANGFLAVYLAGIIAGNQRFIHKKSLILFHNGLAWLMQITMFLILGLLVKPAQIISVAGPGLLMTIYLMAIARPVSIFVTLSATTLSLREKTFLSWIGLRGAAPIILATYPLLAGIPQAELIFDIVFFVVLASVLFQGPSVPLAARWLGLAVPLRLPRVYPIEFTPVGGLRSELLELIISSESAAAGKAIVNLKLPADFLIVLIARGDEFLLPSGGTILLANDTLLVLAEPEVFHQVKAQISVPD